MTKDLYHKNETKLVLRSDQKPDQKVQKDSKPTTSQNKTKTKQTRKSNDRNQADALVNQNVHRWKLGKEVGRTVVVESFASATISDMSHYLKPTLGKKPDQIVLHVGTNDIGNNPTSNC